MLHEFPIIMDSIMRFRLKILPPCVLAMFLVGCGEQPQPKMEVTQAAKLPAKPSKKREPRPASNPQRSQCQQRQSRISWPRPASNRAPAICAIKRWLPQETSIDTSIRCISALQPATGTSPSCSPPASPTDLAKFCPETRRTARFEATSRPRPFGPQSHPGLHRPVSCTGEPRARAGLPSSLADWESIRDPKVPEWPPAF